METKFNVNSQVCTDKNQSERLLALGLKKETADMYYRFYDENTYEINPTWETIWDDRNDYKKIIPAWSLHRLIEMVKKSDYLHYNDMGCIKLYLEQDDFDRVIAIISVMVKEGYFNKEYLV